MAGSNLRSNPSRPILVNHIYIYIHDFEMFNHLLGEEGKAGADVSSTIIP